MTLYRESVRLACGSYPEHMYFDVMLKYAQPQVQVIETNRTRDNIASLSAQFNSMLSQIRAGRFEPYALGGYLDVQSQSVQLLEHLPVRARQEILF